MSSWGLCLGQSGDSWWEGAEGQQCHQRATIKLAFIPLVYISQIKYVYVCTKSPSIVLRHCNNVVSLSILYQTLNVLHINSNSKGFSFLTQIWVRRQRFHSHSTHYFPLSLSLHLTSASWFLVLWGSRLRAPPCGKILSQVLFLGPSSLKPLCKSHKISSAKKKPTTKP